MDETHLQVQISDRIPDLVYIELDIYIDALTCLGTLKKSCHPPEPKTATDVVEPVCRAGQYTRGIREKFSDSKGFSTDRMIFKASLCVFSCFKLLHVAALS